jgi:hypothetical protein
VDTFPQKNFAFNNFRELNRQYVPAALDCVAQCGLDDCILLESTYQIDSMRLDFCLFLCSYHDFATGVQVVSQSAKSYSAVLCHRCADPIPVSEKVSGLCKVEDTDLEVPHTFIARCKLCAYEDVYLVRAVQTFEGDPRKRKGATVCGPVPRFARIRS